MSDARDDADTLPTTSGEVVSQAEIDAVLEDPTLSDPEREARLAELRQRLLDAEHAAGDDSYEPLQTRIMDALSMVAQGGHDYANPLRVEAEAPDGTRAPLDVDRE